MTIEIWLAFITSIVVLFLIPGPIMILVVSESINNGKKSVLPLVSGVLLGGFIAMSLSLLGLGAILATSATLFLMLKWLGVCYLIYLGIKTWKQKPQIFTEDGINPGSSKKMFGSAFLVTALNPKDIIFYVAFLPQFVNPASEPLPQIAILMATFLFVDMLFIISFAVFAHTMRTKISSVDTQRKVNRVGGGALVGAGLITATMQRS
ncbi:LysE family translocator [uncultured Cocleimonas sp.]|uniref:LysE family translocator n=1 Tax=uncultured Cocleimonas sp. TaxID=1051587 RepID=UPI002607D554|nr:LysE family translocator [uncultured Cocleimonas sp.]